MIGIYSTISMLLTIPSLASSVPNWADSVIHLRYALNVGRTYTWRLVADQFIVNKRAVRINASFNLDALDTDIAGNTQVRIRVRSSDENASVTRLIDSAKSGLYPVSSRRGNKAGVYDAVIDQIGSIITGQFAISDTVPPPIFTAGMAATNQFDHNSEIDVPSMMNMMMPALSNDERVRMKVTKRDTVLLPSALQQVRSQSGAVAPEASNRVVRMDTLFREITLDSVVINGSQRALACLSVITSRHNWSGSRARSVASVKRDILTGLVEQIVERGYRDEPGSEFEPIYVAVALLDTNLTWTPSDLNTVMQPPPSLAPLKLRGSTGVR